MDNSPPLNSFGQMDEMFGTESCLPAVREPREVVVVPRITQGPIGGDERMNDLAVTRETMHRILGKAEDALDDILKLARSGESARSFEVAGNLIKTITDVSGQLIDLHKKAQELEEDGDETPKVQYIENQTVFNGTTADLLRDIRRSKEVVINGDTIEN